MIIIDSIIAAEAKESSEQMQEGIDYTLIGKDTFKMLKSWHCTSCNLFFSGYGDYTYNVKQLHVPDSDECKNRKDHKICWRHEYGVHIPLKCKKCSERFTTKNIDYIGARSIFRDYSKEYEGLDPQSHILALQRRALEGRENPVDPCDHDEEHICDL